jgi:hypothetical protein
MQMEAWPLLSGRKGLFSFTEDEAVFKVAAASETIDVQIVHCE